jgi:hypothetical protein
MRGDGMKLKWPHFKHHPGICPEKLTRNKEHLSKYCLCWPRYEPGTYRIRNWNACLFTAILDTRHVNYSLS